MNQLAKLDLNKCLTLQQVMGFLNCGRSSVFNYRRLGILPEPDYLYQRQVFWDKKKFKDWVQNNSKLHALMIVNSAKEGVK